MGQVSRNLSEYLRKRDFKQTPEPKTKTGERRRQLVVQHHLATRDHYDLRLEIGGVLVSWAVTRGPSADPHDKRLAVRTEDHPLSYQSFEGIIPEGNYGAGIVQLWEYATYEPLNGDPAEALAEGHLKFQAKGERMQGRWVLVRLKSPQKRESWLLIKERDEFAESPSSLLDRFPGSVATGRTTKEIGLGREARNGNAGESSRIPAFIAPELCGQQEEPPEGKDWLYEMKYDGYRLMLAKGPGGVRIYTRSGLDWTAKFNPLAEEAARFDCQSCLLDGEAVVLDARGISDFPALVSALEQGKLGQIQLMLFDALKVDGDDLRPLPLEKRKARLEKLMNKTKRSAIRFADDWRGRGAEFFARALAAGAEGIIAKRRKASYRSGRFDDWLKIKGVQRTDVIIIGYQPSEKHESFASLLGAEATGKGLRYAGKIGTGYNARTRQNLAPLLAKTRTKPPDLENAELLPRGAVYLQEPFSAEIGFAGWTGGRQIRQGRFLGVQSDRPKPKVPAVKKRAPSPPAKTASKNRKRKPADSEGGWSVTHPDRVVFAQSGITKGDVARYYGLVQERMLPHLRKRPVSLLRAPESIAETFFQRHPLPGMNKGIVPVEEPAGGYFALDGSTGLHTAVQFGSIEIHGWNTTTDDIGHPDRIVFDLDPGEGVDFEAVKQGAEKLRAYLSAAAIRSWPMLSGGKGIHVIIPLDRQSTAEDVTLFSREIAKGISRDEPKLFLATMSKAQRSGRIFIDWLRNQQKATAIVPWSVRARPGAPVALPVTWQSLKRYKSANTATIETALKVPDWKDFFNSPQTLDKRVLQYLKQSQ